MPHYHNTGERKLVKKNDDNPNRELPETSIEQRLDTIISLLINPKISDDTFTNKIKYLIKMSFSNDDIARILDTTKCSVEAQKYKKPQPKKDLEKSKKT